MTLKLYNEVVISTENPEIIEQHLKYGAVEIKDKKPVKQVKKEEPAQDIVELKK